MKNRYTGLIACIAGLAVGLALFVLVWANSGGTLTARIQGWPTFSGRYFTIRVPLYWGDVTNNSFDVVHEGQANTEVEAVEWRMNGVEGAYADVRARYEPYSELVSVVDSMPFQAGDLTGEARTWTYTDTGFTNLEIVLPGTPDRGGPVNFRALLEMPVSLPQDQQDLITRDFKEAVASLAPSQEALQSTPTAIPAPPGVQTCSADSLKADTDGQGCTGFFCGIIILTNTGPIACSVHGRPNIKYIDHDGKSLPVSQYSLPPLSGNVDSEVVLQPGGIAHLSFRTPSAQCGWSERVPITAAVVMELPGLSRPITLRGESTFNVCGNDLPRVGWFEVGTFEATK